MGTQAVSLAMLIWGAPGLALALPRTQTIGRLCWTGTGTPFGLIWWGGVNQQGTILAWVYLTAYPSELGRDWVQIVNQSVYDSDFEIVMNSSNNRARFYTDASAADYTMWPDLLPRNEWHFLAATFTARGPRRVYVDGTLVGETNPCPPRNYFGTGRVEIGGSLYWQGRNGEGRWFQGMIDEVAIFDRQLTTTEISELWASRTTVPEPAAGMAAVAAGLLGFAVWRWQSRR